MQYIHLCKLLKRINPCTLLLLITCIASLISPNSVQAAAPQLQSEAAIILDTKTNEILYEKNAYQQMYPASITKIVTGILALEKAADLSEKVTVSEKARYVIGTRVYLLEGEEMALSQLLQGLLISSGNDAAIAIAEHLSGSVEAFADEMNRFISEKIGVSQSHFSNPHGLFSPDHYTTAYDMAKISAYAMENDTFREIVGTNMIEWTGEGWETEIYNHNRLIRQYEGATGLKNGFVSQSGYTLVASAQRGDRELIGVTLNSPSADIAYREMTSLLDYGFDAFEVEQIDAGQEFTAYNKLYRVTEPYYFNVPTGVEWTAQIVEGSIQIHAENGKILATSPPLQKLIDEEDNDQGFTSATDNVEQVKSSHENGINHLGLSLWQYILLALSIVLVGSGAFFIIRKIRSKRKRIFYS